MKILLILRRLFGSRPVAPKDQGRAHALEPLDHPELKRMSLRELADLPLTRFCREGRS
jgi:hypothetical protein